MIQYEYLLVISPSGNVSADIAKIKRIFGEHYGCLFADRLISHLTLSNFIQGASYEERLIEWFKRYASSIDPLKINLNGFGMFKKHTIYVNVEQQKPLLEIIKGFKVRFRKQLQGFKEFPPVFVNHLHVTIARRMNDLQAERAWQDWQHREFEGAFEANTMVLLRRTFDSLTGETGYYKEVESFRFEGKNLYGRQLGLF
jgi:2'-5' RNA ligase